MFYILRGGEKQSLYTSYVSSEVVQETSCKLTVVIVVIYYVLVQPYWTTSNLYSYAVMPQP